MGTHRLVVQIGHLPQDFERDTSHELELERTPLLIAEVLHAQECLAQGYQLGFISTFPHKPSLNVLSRAIAPAIEPVLRTTT